MAGLASVVLALSVLFWAGAARAGDLFTGFQLDGEGEYFSYLGVREDLPWERAGFRASAQLFVAGQSYAYESGDEGVDAEVQSVIPSLGVSRALGSEGWRVSGLVGPKLEWKQEEGAAHGSRREFDVGAFVQAETMYWRETYSFHGMLSYASLDDFFFGRVRAKVLAHPREAGCCALFTGLDLAGMGNDDFAAVQAGPLLELPIGGFFLLARGGYQRDSSFGGGGYGGLELYTPF